MKRAVLSSVLLVLACGDSEGTVEMTGTDTDDGTTSFTSFGTTEDSDSTGGGTTGVATSTGEDESSSSGGEDPVDPLVWSDDCVVAGADLKQLHPELQCTALDVPIDHEDPGSTPITITALRVQTKAAERKGQFWMLDGGPGGSGLGFFDSGPVLTALLDAGWDVVVPPHRGTLSPALRCAAPGTASCRGELDDAWGDDLRHFNTVQAAYDVGELVKRSEAELGEPTVVYGVSYGTYWAQAYVGLYPDQAEGIILDSVLPLGGTVLEQEARTQERGVELLQRCIDDPSCGTTLPFASGQAFADAVVAAFDEGDCGQGDPGVWADSSIRNTFGGLVNSHKTRNYLPVLAALLQTCDPDNTTVAQQAMQELFNLTFSAAPPPPMPLRWWPVQHAPDPQKGGIPFELYYSNEVFSAVAGTTIVGDEEDFAGPLGDAASNLLTLGMLESVATSTEPFADLPNVEVPELVAPSAPVLVLNGNYDLQTVLPWAEGVASTLEVELLAIDDGSHGLMYPGSGGEALDDTPCVFPIMLEYAADPSSAPDLSCLDTLPSLDVSLQRPDLQEWSVQAFGTDDPWSLVP